MSHHPSHPSSLTDTVGSLQQNAPASLCGRKLSYPGEIDEQLGKWVRSQQAQGVVLSADVLRKEALRVIQPFCYEFKASTGWLDKFLSRHKLTLNPVQKALSPSSENNTLYNDSIHVVLSNEHQQPPPSGTPGVHLQQPQVSGAGVLDNHDDDEDDDEDDEVDKKDNLSLISHQRPVNPERLKAFNMFVRLFVDENLDRLVPISKQPKEKINAIIISCQRQFPEFSDRARKRIRTYLKSCRRSTKLREPSSRPSMSHIPATQLTEVNNILAKACQNESHEVAKRQRLDSNGTALPTAFYTSNNTTSLQTSSNPLPVALPHSEVFQSFVSSKMKQPAVKLSQTEVTSIRNLIAGYKQSAMFLQRSAEELERFLLQCEAYVDKEEDKVEKKSDEKHLQAQVPTSVSTSKSSSNTILLKPITESSVLSSVKTSEVYTRSSIVHSIPSLIPRTSRSSVARTANNSLIVDSLLKTKVDALKEKLVIKADMIHGTATSVISPTRINNNNTNNNTNEEAQSLLKSGHAPIEVTVTQKVPPIVITKSQAEKPCEIKSTELSKSVSAPPTSPPKLLNTLSKDNGDMTVRSGTESAIQKESNTPVVNAISSTPISQTKTAEVLTSSEEKKVVGNVVDHNRSFENKTVSSKDGNTSRPQLVDVKLESSQLLPDESCKDSKPKGQVIREDDKQLNKDQNIPQQTKHLAERENKPQHHERESEHQSKQERGDKYQVYQQQVREQQHLFEREHQQQQERQEKEQQQRLEREKQQHQQRVDREQQQQQQQLRFEREHQQQQQQRQEKDQQAHRLEREHRFQEMEIDTLHSIGHTINHHGVPSDHSNMYASDMQHQMHNTRMNQLNAQHMPHEQMYRHSEKPSTPLSLEHLQNYSSQHSPTVHNAALYQQQSKQMHKHTSMQSVPFNMPHINDHLSSRDNINHTPPMHHGNHQNVSNHANAGGHGDQSVHHSSDSVANHQAHSNPFGQQYFNSTRHAHLSPKMSPMGQQSQSRGPYSATYHHQATPGSHHANIFSFDGNVSQQVLDSTHQQYLHQRISPHTGGYHGNILSPSSSPHISDHLARQSHIQELNRQQVLSEMGRQPTHSDYANMPHTLQFDMHQAH